MNEIERLSNENYLESFRVHARFQEPCEVKDRDGILLVAGASDFPGSYWNAAARTTLQVKPDALVKAAHAFFAPKRRMYSLSVIGNQDGDLEDYLRTHGYELRFEMPCLSLTRPLPSREVPDGLRVVTITEPKHTRDFVELSVEAYAQMRLPERHTRALFSKPEAMLADNIAGFIVYRGEEALAGALVMMSGDGAGIYWVGTRPSAERMGLATLLTTLTANAAFARGARVVTLQASKSGEPVYRRLGFEFYDNIRRYGPASLD